MIITNNVEFDEIGSEALSLQRDPATYMSENINERTAKHSLFGYYVPLNT